MFLKFSLCVRGSVFQRSLFDTQLVNFSTFLHQGLRQATVMKCIIDSQGSRFLFLDMLETRHVLWTRYAIQAVVHSSIK